MTDKKYSNLILDAGSTSYVNAYHLASRIKQEVGPFLSHLSISGTVSGYGGYYNFYNIGATSDPAYLQVIKNGLQYAKDGKGASQTIKDKYIIPWNTKQKSITGGAVFIGSSYINVGQNTIYLQKFDVNDERSITLFWHQYMTNVLAPYSEAKIIYTGYSNSGLLDSSMNFLIPVYNNMPIYAQESPNILDKDFDVDTTKMYANVQTTLNVRTGPGTSYEVLTLINKNDILTRIRKGKQSGELWDKVLLENGIVGYVFQNYLVEVPKIEILNINLTIDKSKISKKETIKLNVEILPSEAKDEKVIFKSSNSVVATVDNKGMITGVSPGTTIITVLSDDGKVSKSIEVNVYNKIEDLYLDSGDIILEKGKTFKVNAIIYPNNASNQNVIWSSSDTNIAQVDQNGNITAIKEGNVKIKAITEEGEKERSINLNVVPNIEGTEIVFDEALKIDGNIISGLNYMDTTVYNIKSKISTELVVEIYNNNVILNDNENVGTGSKMIFKNENDEVIVEYNILLYGDINGDGKINSVDTLILQRHILKRQFFEGLYLKSANVIKNNKNPSSADFLKIQRHILKLKIIKQ